MRPRRIVAFRSLLPTTLVTGMLVACTAGCGTLSVLARSFENPRLALVSSRVTGLSLAVARVLLAVEVTNPNTYELRAGDLRYRLRVNDTLVAEGSHSAATRFPPGGAVTVEVPLTIRLQALAEAAQAAFLTGEVPYRLEVQLSVGTWLFEREVSFRDDSVLQFNLPLGLAGAREQPAAATSADGNVPGSKAARIRKG